MKMGIFQLFENFCFDMVTTKYENVFINCKLNEVIYLFLLFIKTQKVSSEKSSYVCRHTKKSRGLLERKSDSTELYKFIVIAW